MNTILGELGKNQKFREYIKNIESQKSPIAISGLTDVGMVQMIAATNEFAKKPICIITYNEIQARKLYQDLKKLIKQTYFFPKKEITSYDYVAQSKEIEYKRIDVLNKMYLAKKQKELPYERIEALNQIQEMKTGIVVTTIEAVSQKMISKEALYKNVLKFRIGEEHKLEDVKQKLIDLGYVRYDLIDGRGQFSVRGRNCRCINNREKRNKNRILGR